MQKTGIVVKMTIVTFIFFMLYIGGSLFLERVFFENFYLEKKVSSISKSISLFANQYNSSSWDNQELKDNISLFNNRNGVELTILDKYGNIKSEKLYQIIVQTNDGRILNLHLNHGLNNKSGALLTLKYGDLIDFYGFEWSGNASIFKPLVIIHDENTILESISEEERVNYALVSGKIIGVELPSYSEMRSAFYKQSIREIILDFMSNQGNRYMYLSKSGVYERLNEDEHYKQLIFYQPINSYKDREMIFVLTSSRHISEAKEILSDFHLYIMLFSVLLIVFLSYFYSRTLLRPLLDINKIAESMANLDFSKKIEITRNDEIGSLSVSLNTLSTNLSMSMENLQDANAQLKIEILKERKLDGLRKEFVSGVSHELKTPLGIIRGFAEGIKDDVFEDTTYYLDVIIEETEKMDALVVDMLELSRLESSNFKIYKKYFNLVNLVEFIATKFEYNLKEKNLSIEFINKTDDYECLGDEIRIEQVLVNFMSNAIRHSYRNENIYVTIQKEKNKLKCSVENIGDLIPENKILKVWNRFYRVEASRNKNDGGTGLGLAIVKNILELHNAKFGVNNTKNGVSFYFYLDVKRRTIISLPDKKI